MGTNHRLPLGYLIAPGGISERQLRGLRRQFKRTARAGEVGTVLAVPTGVEYRTLTPDPQAAFTLRAVMAAHQAAVANLARLRAQQAAPVDDSPAAMLAAAARAERRARDIEAAEAREEEVRAELAEAHARATGQAPPEGTVTTTTEPDQARRTAAAELEEARLIEDAAREKLVALRAGPAALHTARARHLRKQGATVTLLGVLGALCVATGFPPVVPVVAFTLMCAVIVLGVYNVTETNRRIEVVRRHIPVADAEHDAAFRRMVAAEAGAIAAGIELTPSTLDADVERAERTPVRLSWDT